MERKESCYGCYYWNIDDMSRLLKPEELGREQCRRHAPEAGQEGDDGCPDPVWPCTNYDDWCGDYRSIIKKRPEDSE
jgi:hypothetical protein